MKVVFQNKDKTKDSQKSRVRVKNKSNTSTPIKKMFFSKDYWKKRYWIDLDRPKFKSK